jgi:hypothetical protein
MMAQRQPGTQTQDSGESLDEGPAERHEPGQPTRGAPPHADQESEKIARQQGTSQRGFTEDEGASPDSGTRTSGDPGSVGDRVEGAPGASQPKP